MKQLDTMSINPSARRESGALTPCTGKNVYTKFQKSETSVKRLAILPAKIAGMDVPKVSSKASEMKLPVLTFAERENNEKVGRRMDYRNKKRNHEKAKEKVRGRVKYTPQFGQYCSQLVTLKKYASVNAFGIVESCLAYYVTLMDVQSVSGAVACTFSFAKHFYPDLTITGTIYKYIVEILGADAVSPQADLPEWLIAMKEAKINWTAVVHNPAFGRISSLISMALTLGILSGTKFEYKIGALKLFSIEAMKGQASCITLVDALWSTLIYFLEGGYILWMDHSFNGFLFSDSAALEFDKEFACLKEYSVYAMVGSLEKEKNVTFNEFDCRLKKLIEKADMIYRGMDPGAERSIIYSRTNVLRELHANFVLSRSACKLRVSPFTFMILGESGVGKSTSTDIFTKFILMRNGYPYGPEYLATADDEDPYYSTIKNHTTGIKRDDVGNKPPTPNGSTRPDLMILLANNQCVCLPAADLESKGKKFPAPYVIGGNSNVRDYNAKMTSMEPASVIRRWDIEIVQTVKPQFRIEGGVSIDKPKVYEVYGENPSVLTDIWDFTLYRCLILPKKKKLDLTGRPQPHTPNDYVRFVPDYKGTKLQDVGLPVILDYIEDITKEHFKIQRSIVAGSENVEIALQPCLKCSKVKQFCICPEGPTHTVVCDSCIPDDSDDDDSENTSISSINSDEVLDDCRADIIMPEAGFMPRAAKALLSLLNTDDSEHLMNKLDEDREKFDEYMEEQVYLQFKKLCNSKWTHWTTYIPTAWLSTEGGVQAICLDYREDIVKNVKYEIYIKFMYIALLFIVLIISTFFRRYFIPLFSAFSCIEYGNKNIVNDYVLDFAIYIKRKFEWEFDIKKNDLFWRYIFRYIFIFFALNIRSSNEWWIIVTFCVVGAYLLNLLLTYARIVEKEKQKCIKKILESRTINTQSMFSEIREKYFAYGIATFTSAAILYSAYKLYQISKFDITSQANLDAVEISDILIRDHEEKDENYLRDWEKIHIESLPEVRQSKPEELKNIVKKNLVFVIFSDSRFSDGLFVKTNFLLVPAHALKDTDRSIKVVRKPNFDGKCMNSSFTTTFNPKNVIILPKHDLALIFVPNSGDFSNILDCFPRKSIDYPYVHMLYRHKDGKVIGGAINDFKVRENISNGTSKKFLGAEYTTPFPTFNGLCCAVLYSEMKVSCIVGLHLGGVIGKRTGVCAQVLRQELEAGIEKYSLRPGVVVSADPGELPEKQYGVLITVPKPLDKHDPITHIKDDNLHCEIYGKCIGKATAKTSVVDTVISKSVEEHMGVPQLWGPPKLKGVDGKSGHVPWRAHLDAILKSSPGIDPAHLEWAVEDYTNTLISIYDRQKEVWKDRFKPLTRKEIMDGRVGQRFIEPIVTKTSAGAPLAGPKSKYITIIEEDNQISRVLDEQFWKVYEEYKQKYLRDERVYPLFKASLKDEPTKQTKDKVRVFTAAPLAYQLLVREYFLPVLQFLGYNPLETSVAVGVNPIGPDWESIAKHLSKFNKTNMIFLDYKLYDTAMPSQMTMAALSICVKLAEYTKNYTQDDIKIMRNMIVDVVNPTICHNGTLIQVHGFWCSGINFTANVGSMINTLYGRSVFRSVYPDFKGKYTDVVAEVTYGDDRTSNVDEKYDLFNNISFRDYLAQYGVTVTSGRKDGELKKYDHFDDTDFLKRRFRFDEDVQHYLGPLAEESIFKSLHAIKESKVVTNKVVSAGNIDNALSEFFLHGRELYEKRRTQLTEVAKDCDLTNLCKTIGMSYDSRKDAYLEKYYGIVPPENQDEGFSADEYQFWGEW